MLCAAQVHQMDQINKAGEEGRQQVKRLHQAVALAKREKDTAARDLNTAKEALASCHDAKKVRHSWCV